MTKKLALTIVSFILAFALPVGSAFAAVSPNADSPNVNSPNVNSPNVNSPNVNSPNVNSPNVDSPNVDSPNVDSPNVGSPNVSTPQGYASNVAANAVKGAPAATATTADGALASPQSGALNLQVVAAGTVVLLVGAGAAAWALRRKLQ